MERYFLRLAPNDARWEHDYDGAHQTSSLVGLCLGTQQGIWLGEHRINGGARKIIAALRGE